MTSPAVSPRFVLPLHSCALLALMVCASIVCPAIATAQRPLGIDVSHWQGNGINWGSVKASGVTFAWAKASEGTGYTDPSFTINAANAKSAGVLIGAYHFARYDLNIGTAGAQAEAAYFWSVAGNYIKNGGYYLMPMLDVEHATGTNYNYTKTTLSQWVNTWCSNVVQRAAANGVVVKPVIYTGVSFGSTWLNSSVTQWTPWIANWNGQNPQTGGPNGTSPWSTWTVWQYTDAVSVSGAGTVDGDVFNGTAAGLISTLVIGSPLPKITSQPFNLTRLIHSNATFTVAATGTAPLRYQWRFNQTNIVGATSPSYSIPLIQLTNAGGYSVMVSNAAGTTLSDVAALSVLWPLTNAPGCIVSPSGMIDWWPGEANPRDIYSTNDYTPWNNFSYTAGRQGQAFNFDGLSSYLTNNAPSVPVPWTACMWVKRKNAPGSGAALLSDGLYELKLEQYNGTRQVGLTRFGTGDYSFGYIVPTDTWTHLAFVGTSAGTSLYVNGAFQSSLTNTLPLPRAYLGAGYAASSSRVVDYLYGGLDEVLLYNRALSGAEISAIYSAGAAGLVRIPEFTGMLPVGPSQFRLNLRGQTGKSLTMYASPDLLTWRLLGSIANPVGATQFTDNNATNWQNFYRVSQP